MLLQTLIPESEAKYIQSRISRILCLAKRTSWNTRINKPTYLLDANVNPVSKDASFCDQILNAYGHRCAVTRMQLRLVEAAHILPVSRPESIDDVCNGIALSPTYHRAFDSGLIYLADDYTMSVDSRHETRLLKLDLTAGLEGFKRSLGRIHLPADRRQWPHPSFIKKANRLRGVGS